MVAARSFNQAAAAVQSVCRVIIAYRGIAAIRGRVPVFPSLRCLASVVAFGIALGSAGCAAARESLGPLGQVAETSSVTPEADGASERLWWRTAGDPVLATLIDHGLAGNADLICDAIGLRAREQQALTASRRLGNRIERLFDARTKSADEAASMARAYRYADRRARLAADIAAAYIEMRRLQETYALRSKLLEQFKDNAEVAAFRREAGLVSGLDAGLAGSLVSVTASDLDALRGQIETAERELAYLTGMEPVALKSAVSEGKVPDIAADVSGQARLSLARRADLLALESSLVADMTRRKVTQAELDAVLANDAANAPVGSPAAVAVARYREAQAKAYQDLRQRRDAVAAASARRAELEKSNQQARATVRDARLAYRNGTGDFAALYVAESAVLAVDEARVRTRAALAEATVRLWAAEGSGWTRADLALPPPAAAVSPEVTVCE